MSGRERGWSGDLRRSPKAPLNVPSVDPDDQLESVGASSLAPTKLDNHACCRSLASTIVGSCLPDPSS
jgi:hypothetical protein